MAVTSLLVRHGMWLFPPVDENGTSLTAGHNSFNGLAILESQRLRSRSSFGRRPIVRALVKSRDESGVGAYCLMLSCTFDRSR